MNKRNKVKQLNRDSKHRKALIGNMVTSLLAHERIESTLAKIKVIRSHAEKIITRAKKNIDETKEEVILHNKREVMKRIKDRDVVAKLFNDIAPRFKERAGGYTRIYRLVNRDSDNSEMGILELTERKTRDELQAEKKAKREAKLTASKDKKKTLEKKSK
ncbi:MAG: 50S ribosomal protein L17 [Leptospiraceae bacterium]|nr:50S ribosomal protein L17 [Leptospiraceae bacterium]